MRSGPISGVREENTRKRNHVRPVSENAGGGGAATIWRQKKMEEAAAGGDDCEEKAKAPRNKVLDHWRRRT